MGKNNLKDMPEQIYCLNFKYIDFEPELKMQFTGRVVHVESINDLVIAKEDGMIQLSKNGLKPVCRIGIAIGPGIVGRPSSYEFNDFKKGDTLFLHFADNEKKYINSGILNVFVKRTC